MKILNRFTWIFIISVYLFSTCTYSQYVDQTTLEQAYDLVKAKYGPDPVLVNGKYFEDIYRFDLNHPYYLKDEFLSGIITVHNKKIDNINLKYNIYDQTIIVSYSDGNSSSLIFIPPPEFISGFSILDQDFKKYKLSGRNPEFYNDVFVSSDLSFKYGWSKKRYDSYHNKTFKAYKYSRDQQKLFYCIENSSYLIKSNKSFIKTFKKDYRKDVSDYLKLHKINLKKSNPQELKELGAFCVNLLYQT